MSSASFFEQLTSSVSIVFVLSISVITLGVILVFTVVSRTLFSSSSKSSSLKQRANKEKKTKETNAKKQQQTDTTSPTKKKNTNKTKQDVTTTVPPTTLKTVISSSSLSSMNSQSEESEHEKVNLLSAKKKSTKLNKESIEKKIIAANEKKESTIANNEIKAPLTNQQKTLERTENADGISSDAGKKKQSKAAEIIGASKQQTTKKGDTINKSVSNKKQPIAINADTAKSTSVDETIDNDHEDEGQWLTQGNKQINSRNRNKPKVELLNSIKQEPQTSSPSSSNHRTSVEKRTPPSTTNVISSSSATTNKNESDADVVLSSNVIVTPEPQIQEPIEICELLPMNENRYTASDDWWKKTLNKQQTFSVDDIGEWPEHEQDERYVVQVKRIIPMNNINKIALAEKNINVDGNDSIDKNTNGKEDEKLNSNEQAHSSSSVTGESVKTLQSKKKSNIRRIS